MYKNEERVKAMLLQFKFKNFKSFADDTTLDMMATNIKEHSTTLLEKNGYKILPVAAIFGANASGKSNLFQAFNAMESDVVRNFEQGKKHSNIRPYIFNQSLDNDPSEFEVSINMDDMEYRYGFARNQEKVFEEWLFERKFSKGSKTKEKCVFYRVDNKLEVVINSEDKNEIEYVSSMVNDSELLISNLGRRNKSIYAKIFKWFILVPVVVDSSSYLVDNSMKEASTMYLYKDNKFLRLIIELVQKFDNSITDIKIEMEKDKDLNDKYVVYSKHICSDGKEKWIPFKSESSGTQKIFALGTFLHIALNDGRVIFIDELDTKLHPLVLRYIIKQFRDKEINRGGQLVFSSHNIIVLDSSDLRRDEIWFVEKVNQKSNLYSLYDFKEDVNTIRSDLDFGKHYLSGRFGAVPFQDEEV